MVTCNQNSKRGYTIVELMVTIVIVACLVAVVGYFLVKLLRLQESEREEAYVREKLVEICGNYADAISVGTSFSTNKINSSTLQTIVNYRLEAGGVSLETGTVTRVASFASSLTNGTIALDVWGYKQLEWTNKLPRTANGTALLLPLDSKLVSCTITPLPRNAELTNAVLGSLKVAADYKIEDENGELVTKRVTVERVVRLWNRE